MSRKLLLFPILLIILVIGFHFYKIHSLKSAINPLATKDNILIEEILNIYKTSPNITIGEYLEKAKQNIEKRDDVIYNIKILKPYLYKKKIDMYVELLNLENELVRSEIAASYALLDLSSKIDWANDRIKDLSYSNYYTFDTENKYTERAITEAGEAYKKFEEKRQKTLEVVRKLLSVERTSSKSLSSLIPKRNIITILEEKLKEEAEKNNKEKKST